MDAEIIQIKRAHQRKCQHSNFVVDMALDVVECDSCGDKLSPMWVLRSLSDRKSRLNNQICSQQMLLEKVKEDVEKAKDKARCKCRKCGEMTPIIRFRSV